MIDILMSETCWARKKWNKIASDINLVFYSSSIFQNIIRELIFKTRTSTRGLTWIFVVIFRNWFCQYEKFTHRNNKTFNQPYLFIYLTLWSTSRYTMTSYLSLSTRCRRPSIVATATFNEEDLENATRSWPWTKIEDGGLIARRLSVYPRALLIATSNAISIANHLLHNLKKKAKSHGRNWTLGVRRDFLEPATSAAMQCPCKPLTIKRCHHRRPRKIHIMYFPLLPVEEALWIFNVRFLFKKKTFLKRN